MWPLFGLVTLVAASVYAGVRRYRGSWTGLRKTWLPQRRVTGQTPVSYQASLTGGSAMGKILRVGIRTDTVLDFECKPETRLDRFFKWTGLAVEQQLGHAAFDEAIYLVSDDLRMLEALNDDPRVHQILLSFFSEQLHADYRAVRLVCRGGTLRLDLRERSRAVPRMHEMLDVVMPMLDDLARRLPTRLLREDKARDWAWLRAVLVLALSTGLAIHGGVHLFRLAVYSIDSTLEPMRLVAWMLPVGAGLLGLMVLATLVLLARSSRLHLVMLEVLLVGLFGAFATAFVEVRDANMELDRSEPTTLRATVVEKYSRKSRRTARRYYLVLSDWPVAGEGRARVHGDTYDRVQVGDPVVLYLRQGALQVPWLERVVPASDEPPPRAP